MKHAIRNRHADDLVSALVHFAYGRGVLWPLWVEAALDLLARLRASKRVRRALMVEGEALRVDLHEHTSEACSQTPVHMHNMAVRLGWGWPKDVVHFARACVGLAIEAVARGDVAVATTCTKLAVARWVEQDRAPGADVLAAPVRAAQAALNALAAPLGAYTRDTAALAGWARDNPLAWLYGGGFHPPQKGPDHG